MSNDIVKVSKLELWFARIIIGVVSGTLVWFASSFNSYQVQMARMETELEITKPSEVLAAVNKLEKSILSKEDIKSIIWENSPWSLEVKEWETWKLETEKRLFSLERDINKLKEEANNGK
jgi:hypothetical protein